MTSRLVAFGMAPREIIAMFTMMLKEYESLTVVLRQLLIRRSKRTMKYQFQPLNPKSSLNWTIEVQDHEDLESVQEFLKHLDEYITVNRLKDRASGIEDLMCGPLDDKANDDITDVEVFESKPAEVSEENISDAFAVVESEEQTGSDIEQNNIPQQSTSNMKEFLIFVETEAESSAINRSEKVKSEGDELKCPVCLNLFRSVLDLISHKQEVHDIVTHYCLMCDEEFETERDMNLHCFKKHTKETLQCPLCDALHQSQVSLRDHCRRDHLRHLTIDKQGDFKISDRELTRCDQCDYVALRKGRLSTHLKEAHGITEEIYCSTCEKVFTSHRMLHHHVMQFHTMLNVACDICGKVCRNRSAFQRHRAMHSGQSFKCSVCEKVFSDRRSHLQHEKRHSSKTVFVCPQCGHTFNQKSNMERHLKAVHLNEGKLLCDSCTFTTFYPDALKEHIERTHFGVKRVKFTCKYCGKEFSRRITLDEHVDKHEGRYRYSCGNCGKKYRNKGRCKAHFVQCVMPTIVAEQVKESVENETHQAAHLTIREPVIENCAEDDNMDLVITMEFVEAAASQQNQLLHEALN